MSKRAIVNSGSRKIIGDVEEFGDGPLPGPGNITTIKNAWELRCDMFLVPTPQGPIAMNKTSCVPIDAEEEETEITVMIDNIRYYDDMKDRGRKYELLIDEIKEVMLQTRANRAGIQTASQAPQAPQKSDSGIIL